MKRRWKQWLGVAVILGCFPSESPAPLVYVPGEGWHYESREGGKWVRNRAQDQLAVAQEAYDAGKHGLALKAARRTVKVWPFSDYAPDAQFLIGRCFEAKKKDEAAFKAYQKLLTQYPKQELFEKVTERQYEIANRYLDGQWFRLWNTIPIYPSMDKTIKLYEQIIENGPYSAVAPSSQMKIASAYEKKMVPDYSSAVRSYEQAADRYNGEKTGQEALYMTGITYNRMSKTADYDQSVASQAIDAFSDFNALYPNDDRVPQTEAMITALKTEQARGSYQIARFYEKRKKWEGALIYYNEVLLKDPSSKYADQARQRIEIIKKTRLK